MRYEIPTTATCFWCRQPKQMVVGRYYDPAADYEPCTTCQREHMSRGVFVIEVTNEPNSPNQPCLTKEMPGVFPTGRWAVIARAAALHLGLPEKVIQAKVMTTSREGFAKLTTQARPRPPTLNELLKAPLAGVH